MALWKIERSVIMGVCRSWEGKSVFARAPLLVVRHSFKENMGKVLRVSGYPDAEHLEGDELTFEEGDALVAQGEAMTFDPPIYLPQTGIVCWILRFDSYPNLNRPDWIFADLIYNDALCAKPVRGPNPFTFALMVDEKKSYSIRTKWRGFEIDDAIKMMHLGRWERAAEHAMNAWVISLVPDPTPSALVVFFLEKSGNLTRSQGFLQMLKNSNDADFMAKVEKHIEVLRGDDKE